ncbi:MAG: hypothetical protein AB7O96_16375 [Pseudobdellovibrionaceae bacterium]
MGALQILNEYKQEGLDFSDLLLDPVNLKLLNTLAKFSDLLTHYGYDVRVSSVSSIRKLKEIPFEYKQGIITSFETWCSFIQPVAGEGQVENPMEDIEVKFLRRALDFYGLRMSSEFWASLDKDSLIELYGENMIQLYRSLNFFKYSGYSLLDLSVHEWYVLWERPKRVIDDMNAHVNIVMREYVSIKKFETPRHILRETYNTGQTEPFVPRAIFVDFKNIGSLEDANAPGVVKGLVVTSKAQIAAEGADAFNIQFV